MVLPPDICTFFLFLGIVSMLFPRNVRAGVKSLGNATRAMAYMGLAANIGRPFWYLTHVAVSHEPDLWILAAPVYTCSSATREEGACWGRKKVHLLNAVKMPHAISVLASKPMAWERRTCRPVPWLA